MQTLFFTATIRTADKSYDQSGLADGRKIDSLPCFISIGAAEADELKGFLIFQPEYVSTDSDISSSLDHLLIEAYLPVPLFHELWAVVEDGVRIEFFGKVAGMASKTAHSLSPYKWGHPQLCIESEIS